MKRTATSLAWTLAAIALLVGALAVFRIPVAETGISWWFAREGLARPGFRIERLDLGGLELADITAGTNAALRIDRIDIAWSPETLTAARVERVTVVGLQLRAQFDEQGLGIPGIDLPAGKEGGDRMALPVLPASEIDLADARLALTTPYGPITATATATYTNAAGASSLAVNGTAEGEPGRAGFAVSANSSEAGAIDGSITIADGAVDIPALRIPSFGGTGRFVFSGGRLADVSGSLRAPTVETPTIPQLATGRLEVEGSRADDVARLRVVFREMPVDHGMSIRATISDIAIGEGSASARALVEVNAVDYAIAGVEVRDLVVQLPLKVQRENELITLSFAKDGHIRAGGIKAYGIAATEPVSVRLPVSETPPATIETEADGTIVAVTHRVTGAIAANALSVVLDGAPPRRLTLGETRFHLRGRFTLPDGYTGRTTLANSAGTLDDPALRFTQIEADIKPADLAGNGSALFDIGKVTDIAAAPLFRPVGVALDVTRTDGAMRIAASVRDATQTIRATASGPWPLAGPRDVIQIDIPPLAFESGGKQPSTLLPFLSALDVSRGSVSGSGQVRRDGDGYRISGDARIAGLDFAVAGAEIANLNANISLDSLQPLATPPGQEVTIDRIDLVTPLDDVRLVYRLADAGGTPRLDIASARAGLLGGTVNLADTRLALDGTPADLSLAVAKLDVAEMLALLGIEGIAGTGTLSGTLPLRLSPSVAEIRDGRLAADGPGVLRLDSAAAADFLAAQGPSVDLAVRALEDFHYSELTIDVAREAGGEARLALSMLGNNPAVLDAHPFRFNINLKSNVDSLIDALLKGYRIATERVGQKP